MGKRALIVEDNSILQLIEKTFLEDSGLTVDCAESGETALSLIEDPSCKIHNAKVICSK